MLFINNGLNKETKKDLKKSKKEKKRCKRSYPDWKDNEFNCGPLKFIWGVKSHDDLTLSDSNFYTLNDLDISYNRDTKKYLLGLETIFFFENVNAKIYYLETLLEKFREYLFSSSCWDSKFDPFFLYLYNDGNLFQADSLTELYYKFKIFVKGFM